MTVDLKTKPEAYFTGDRPEMVKYIPSGARRILEVGCGEGNFGAHLKEKHQAEVWGVEFEPDRAAAAAGRLHRVFAGDVSSLMNQLPENYFDVVVFNDVLEHLTDPYSVLEKMKTKLSENGIVISSIPNIRYFRNFYDLVFRKNWDYTDNGIMDKTHYRFFTVRSIRKMYENVGYEVVQMEGINATKSIRPFLWNVLFLGLFSDIKYLQFATVARPRGK